MSIFNVNFSNFGSELLPPDKRNSRLVKLVSVLLSQIQYLRDIIFDSYGNGSTAPAYSAGAYILGARVVYKHNVYESLTAGNTDVPPSVNWFLVQNNAIGINEQVLYSGQKIVLEYALNRWFGTNFIQPPGQSDIYLTNSAQAVAVFRVGGTENNSSKVFLTISSEFIINSYVTTGTANLTINIPIAVFTALDPLLINRFALVNSIVNQYLPAGITYAIQTY